MQHSVLQSKFSINFTCGTCQCKYLLHFCEFDLDICILLCHFSRRTTLKYLELFLTTFIFFFFFTLFSSFFQHSFNIEIFFSILSQVMKFSLCLVVLQGEYDSIMQRLIQKHSNILISLFYIFVITSINISSMCIFMNYILKVA